MFVIKRNGNKETVKFDKITSRIEKLIDFKGVDPIIITQKLTTRIFPGITTTELDILASQICMSMTMEHPNFGVLASKIAISNHQKNTDESFLTVAHKLYNNTDILGENSPLVTEEFINLAEKYEDEIRQMIDMKRDFLLDYFGFKTLERSYLLRINIDKDTKQIVERPQHLFMRVALGIYGDDLENVKKLYDNISLKNYTHATPTLFNASSPRNQLASCFLTKIDDSIEGIFETFTDCGLISKWAGGIGCDISDIRSRGSYIRKTGGNSDGIIPLLRTFNSIARQFNQGGKRLGSFAMYLNVHHADIFDFLNAKKNQGAEEERARDLFYAVWIPDLFMEKVMKNEEWYLMDPNQSPGLQEVYGEEFEDLYRKYIHEGKYVKKIEARKLWKAITDAQIELGVPYILYKDACNRKSNQKNIGPIRSSNLCVSGDTMILTSEGYYPIKSLENKNVNVWNGVEWSNTTVRKTGENQKLINIQLTNGMNVRCTEYHKFYIDGYIGTIRASELKVGMKIIDFTLPLINTFTDELTFPYMQGFAGGNYNFISFLSNDFVPINYSLNSRLRWLEGFFDRNGYSFNECICTTSSPKQLINIFYLLQTLGIQSFINGDVLYIYGENIHKLKSLGFNSNALTRKRGHKSSAIFDTNFKEAPQNDVVWDVKIQGISDNNEYEDVFCFNETIEHKGIFNGVILGNCTEILEVSNSDETSVCNLGSICLSSIVEKPEQTGYHSIIWYSLLSDEEKKIADKLYLGKIKLYSSDDCVYCKLLKKLLDETYLTYDIIDKEEALRYKEQSKTTKDFETIPQLFCVSKDEVCHIGGYTDCWKVLSPRVNYIKLYMLAYEMTFNLNKIIDINYYPIEKTKRSNLRHRPIGIGTQGLGDLFFMLKLPFDSDEAREINKKIFETMYFGAMTASYELAVKDGPYSTFEGSPLSKGLFQYNLWGLNDKDLSGMWNWGELREKVIKHGARNSLLIALMPTASTSQIMGSICEAFEPISSNLYTRRTLAGEFVVLNPYLVNDLISIDLWTEDIKTQLQYYKGSVQNIKQIPDFLKKIYRTAYEIPQKSIITMSSERGPFICQSQSLNLFFEKADTAKLNAAHFLGWKLGLKTGSYYIRTKPAMSSQRFGMDIEKEMQIKKEEDEECLVCSA